MVERQSGDQRPQDQAPRPSVVNLSSNSDNVKLATFVMTTGHKLGMTFPVENNVPQTLNCESRTRHSKQAKPQQRQHFFIRPRRSMSQGPVRTSGIAATK